MTEQIHIKSTKYKHYLMQILRMLLSLLTPYDIIVKSEVNE
jgi:hypothetical protein